MGNVIQFKQADTVRPARSIIQCGLDEYLSALAESELTIGVKKAQIEKNIGIIDSIMRSTENPQVRDLALQQLKAIEVQLLLASLNVLNAKRHLQDVAVRVVGKPPQSLERDVQILQCGRNL